MLLASRQQEVKYRMLVGKGCLGHPVAIQRETRTRVRWLFLLKTDLCTQAGGVVHKEPGHMCLIQQLYFIQLAPQPQKSARSSEVAVARSSGQSDCVRYFVIIISVLPLTPRRTVEPRSCRPD